MGGQYCGRTVGLMGIQIGRTGGDKDKRFGGQEGGST